MMDHWIFAIPMTLFAGAFWGGVLILLTLAVSTWFNELRYWWRRRRWDRMEKSVKRAPVLPPPVVPITPEDVNRILNGETVDG